MTSLSWNQITDSRISKLSIPTGAENLSAVEAALHYASLGWKIFPCHGITDQGKCTSGTALGDSTSPGKRPATTNGHKDATSDPETIKRWWYSEPHYNIGVNCKASGFFVIDVDPRNGGHKSFKRLLDLLGEPLSRTLEALTGEYEVDDGVKLRGTHIYFRCDDGEKLASNLSKLNLDGIDIKHNGYVIAAPSRHFTEVEYEWVEGKEPWNCDISYAPKSLLSLIRANTKPTKKGSTKRAKNDFDGFLELPSTDDFDLSSTLKNGISEGERAVVIHKMACSLANKIGTNEMASAMIVAYLREFNRDSVKPPLGEAELEKQIASGISFVISHPFFTGDASSLTGEAPKRADGISSGFKISSGTTEAQMVEGLGEHILNGIVCWTRAYHWLEYDGRKWGEVSTERIKEVIRQHLKSLFKVAVHEGESAETLKRHLSFHTNARIGALENLLRGFAEIDASEFDKNPYLLNVKNGVVDLRTGEHLAWDPKYLFTKITEVDYVANAKHPDIDKALQAIPEECLDYLQVRIGQAASGLTPSDDKIIFAKGGGENGKSLFFTLCKIALGEFYIAVSPKLLGGSDFDHPTEKMPLRGARMAVLEELPDKGGLPMAKLKPLTGTTEITARAIGKNNVTWIATHTLFVTLNNLPNVADTDHGTWRRLEVFPFPYRFVTDAKANESAGIKTGDPTLRQRILESLSGQAEAALAWIVEGARRYFEDSTRYPAVPSLVLSETETWREISDVVLRALKLTVTPDPNSFVIGPDLYGALRENGLGMADSDQQLVEKLKRHDWIVTHSVTSKRKVVPTASGESGRHTVWIGIRLILPVPPVPVTF